MEKTIICIGREYGSGGHAIGKILAKRTGYEFYDKDRFIAIAKERGFEGEVEEYLEEQEKSQDGKQGREYFRRVVGKFALEGQPKVLGIADGWNGHGLIGAGR